ncbi:MAG TPA: hypothetical protein VM033_06900 [Gemmatimonadaceae bacterium]|nr:hypothetical protein [Gemmatimonadaceae bacterium]
MFAHLVAALLQVPSTAPQVATPARAATVADTAADTTREGRRERRRREREQRAPKRVEVTAEHLATAFKDAPARGVLLLAREARLRQDSALASYDATTYQRISAGLGFAKIGRDRLAFRTEDATRVRWRRGVGAYVDVTGSRSVVPIAGKSGGVSSDGSISPVPYYPGSETLWIGSSIARPTVNENDGIVHPLAEGAEAYYTYQTGDSVTFRLPDGNTIRLRELKVRPREPKWNLAVGSLWFDLRGGQLVRAAYRMSVPMDIAAVAEADDSASFRDVPTLMKPLLFPMTAQISAIGVEYGLYQGRFWLPRVQVAEGGARVGVMRVPFKLEQKFQYDQVNAGAPLPPIVVDSTNGRVRREITIGTSAGSGEREPRTRADSLRAERRAARKKCDSAGNRTYTRQREGMPNPVFVTISCDTAKLAHSPDLPASIYDEGEETVGGAEMEALVQQALSMGAQADFVPQLPTVGVDRPRYNRIEALSLGVRADQVLGAGYSLHAAARIGVADREPNVELTGSRSDLRRTRSLTVYNRLVSASDWGNPLSLGSSISAFLFARDEGFYYRASGAELTNAPDAGGESAFAWSLFAEQERTAAQRTTFSLARSVNGAQFEPNVEAVRGLYLGARTRHVRTLGLDPQGLRLFSDARIEAARGDTGSYGRGALDLTTSHGIGNGAASITLAGGSSVGTLPTQRSWFLGGTQTVRGQRPGVMTGNAFWLARAELAHGVGVLRPVLFGDLGWAGDRARWRDVGRPASGVGVGSSLLDGLVRFDVARGIHPEKAWRVNAYLDARF